MKNVGELLKKQGKRIWLVVSRNVVWKLLSIFLSLLLWSYIVSVDSSITRLKTVQHVEVMTNGLAVLQGRELALLTDPNQLTDIMVTVEASQSAYSRVNANNVHVEMNLSQVTKAGTQEVELIGVTAYGKVVQVIPSTVEVVIETRGSRYVPVNVEFTGEVSDQYWYNVNRTNISQVMVTGPYSQIKTVSSARVQVDVTGQTTSYDRSSPLILLDDQGNEVGSPLIPSPSFITLGIDIYPKASVKVNTDIQTATTGTLPEGYYISSISVQPESVTVAGDQSLLDGLDVLNYVPVNVDDRTGSFTTVSTINTLRSLRYISSEQVSVTVYIDELTSSTSLAAHKLTVRGAQEGKTVTSAVSTVSVDLSGAYSLVNTLDAADIQAYVDVTDLEAGTYDLPVTVVSLSGKDLTFAVSPSTVSVTISD